MAERADRADWAERADRADRADRAAETPFSTGRRATMSGALRIANCSGFYGDRFAAAREMIEGGPLDVLTGDYLAELTMLILWKARQRDDSLGYAMTFYRQMEEVLGDCVERGIKVVSNAGGLNPASLAHRLTEIAEKIGIDAKVAYVEGDDVLENLRLLQESGEPLTHLDTGEKLDPTRGGIVSANAYLGGFGIAEALVGGADVVVTGRVTDASLVVGPAAWHFGWRRDQLDELAGAVVAGHVIECGAQATGGNYSFFEEVPGLEHPGFPLAEIYEDGSTVITKHPGTGGRVSRGTVTAQLLYEIAGPMYVNPDVVADFSTTMVEDLGDDRVRLSSTKGHPPPKTLKVSVNLVGGWRNTMTFVLTGLEIQRKADLVIRTLAGLLGGEKGFDAFEDHDVRLVRTDKADAPTNEEADAELRVTVKDRDPSKVGRTFSNAAIELALANYPGFHLTSTPSDASAYGVYWPTLVDRSEVVEVVVHHDGTREHIDNSKLEPGSGQGSSAREMGPGTVPDEDAGRTEEPADWGATKRLALGTVIGARSGDKGPNANVGLWARSDAGFKWLQSVLTTERFRRLLPEAKEMEVDRYELPNLRAVNFVVHGLLGEGVASSTRPDPQAKSLGEYLRSRLIELPVALLADTPKGGGERAR